MCVGRKVTAFALQEAVGGRGCREGMLLFESMTELSSFLNQ